MKRIVKFLFRNTFLWEHLVRLNFELDDRKSRKLFKKIYHDPGKKEIRVAGLKRTGNHAILSWINSQHPGDVVFLNNVPAGQNPLNTLQKERYINFPEKTHRQSCVVYSYEDYPLQDIFSERFEANHDSYLGESKTRYDVIILRDPFNFFASRYKWQGDSLQDEIRRREVVELWKMYAREFVGETNFLRNNKVAINYNSWFSDKSYRAKIAKDLDLIFTDEGFNVVRDYGMGSSFEGTAYHGEAKQMKVLERWKAMSNDELYKSIFRDKEINELSEKIFGRISGTGDFISSLK